MSCASCVNNAEKALTSVLGVNSASINLATETAHVTYSPPADISTLTTALNGAGYPASSKQVVLQISGMNCASCVG